MAKMKHAPVYFTIVQARFNPVLALESYAPTIQDQFRRHGFPDFEPGMVATFNLNIVNSGEAGPPKVPVSQIASYKFSNMEKTAGFILDQGSLSLQTTNYDVFESFSKTFLDGLRTVHEAVGLSYTDRIGVRYLDAVYPQEGEDLSYYLSNAVLGLYGKLNGTLTHSFSETLVKNGSISVIARSIIQEGPIGFPPDLQPGGLAVAEQFQNLAGIHATLDTDGFHGQRTAFDLGQVSIILRSVHSAVTAAFRATVTDGALDAWK